MNWLESVMRAVAQTNKAMDSIPDKAERVPAQISWLVEAPESKNSTPPDRHEAQSSDTRLKAILDKIEATRNYTPKVGIFGNSGVGKSSLCNALFGKNVAKISDVEACTRKPQSIFIGGKNGGIELVDLPGIGEDPEHQTEYVDLYQSLAPELDLVLWAIKSDDRNYASGIDAYQKIFKNRVGLPVVFVITQTDKTNPSRDWSYESFTPSEKQLANIAIKENDVSRRFDVPTSRIVSIAVGEESAEEKYNIITLVDLIVEVLPNEKKYSFAREAKDENVSETSREKAEKGVWDHVKDFAGEAWDSVKSVVTAALLESAGEFALKAAKGLFKKLKFW